VPLREGERLLGLLHFGYRPNRGRPPREDVALLAAVAERAAAALANTQLVAELRRTRHRFERVLDVLAEAVTVRDARGRVVYANEAAVRLLGSGELLSRWELRRPDGTPVGVDELPFRRLLAGRDAPPLLMRATDRATGEQRWLLAKATLLDDDERLVVTIIEDVTGAR
jgi:PAS domain S-box-containing protein